MKFLVMNLMTAFLISCGSSASNEVNGKTQEVKKNSATKQSELLESLEESKEKLLNLGGALVVTKYFAHPLSLDKKQSTFFEEAGKIYKYCENVYRASLSNTGYIESWSQLEETSFILTEDLSSDIKSIEGIYDDCRELIKTTDFSDISDDSVNPGLQRLGIKKFLFETDERGILTQCGIMNYDIADHPGPEKYEIKLLEDLEVSENDFCNQDLSSQY